MKGVSRLTALVSEFTVYQWGLLVGGVVAVLVVSWLLSMHLWLQSPVTQDLLQPLGSQIRSVSLVN